MVRSTARNCKHNQHHYEIQVVVVFRGDTVCQIFRDAVQTLRAVGQPLLVEEAQAHALGDSQGGDCQIVFTQAECQQTYHKCNQSAHSSCR
jgi:hypothetical protein